MNKKIVLISLFVIIGMVAISGCVDDDSSSANDSSSSDDSSSKEESSSGATGTLDDGTSILIPEGFSKVEGNDVFTIATEDQTNVIVVTDGGAIDPEQGKQNQIDNGAEFVADSTVDIASVEVTVQQFTTQGLNLYGYLFTIDGNCFAITQTSTEEQDVTDSSNPVNQIITNLAK